MSIRASEDGTRPRRTLKTSELVARDIATSMRQRKLQPGDMLPPESQLILQYRVSRATLREALRLLEVTGAITIKPGPGGGPVVADISSRDFGSMATLHFFFSGATMKELLEAQLIMEPLLARLAAERQQPERLAELRGLTEDQPPPDDETRYLHVSHGFHHVVAGSSGNRVLDLFARSLTEIFTDRIAGALYPPGSRAHVQREHAAIAGAILRGDGRRAETLMRRHMEEFVQYVASRHPALLEEVVTWA
jgi:DNA-binding FadR family transcriptional regulator